MNTKSNHRFPVTLGALLSGGVLMTVNSTAAEPGDLPATSFVIESEHFDFGGGQSIPAVNTMPYTGAEYLGLSAVHGVDYFANEQRGDGEFYRTGESPNVPMVDNLANQWGKERPGFEVTTNFRIGWAADAEWYHYTREIPAGDYQAYAALSLPGGEMWGRLGLLVSGAGTSQPTVWNLGRFSGPASGSWGNNALVPLVAPNGSNVVIHFNGGATTLRFATGSGDFDWFVLTPVPAVPAYPADLVIRKGLVGAFAGAGVYQTRPTGTQVVTQTVTGTATFQVQVQNDGTTATNLTVRAGEDAAIGWLTTIKAGEVDITAQMIGPSGHLLPEVAPGGTATFTIELKPGRVTPAAEAKAITLAVFTDGEVTSPRDSVRAVAVAGDLIQPDLMVKREFDVNPAGDNLYNATGANQHRRIEVETGASATFLSHLFNDGNSPQAYSLNSVAPPAGWTVRHELSRIQGVGFDGVDDNLFTGTWTPGTRWTVEAWVAPSAEAAGRRTIAGGFGEGRDWGLTLSGDRFGVVIKPPGGVTATISGGDPIVPGQWYHLAGTCDGSTARLYIDGTEVASADVEQDYSGTAIGMLIGSEACCPANSFPGLIRDVRVWDRARTAAEIDAGQALRLTGKEPGLQGAWRLLDGTADAAIDLSPYQRHGTLRNGAAWSREVLDITAAMTGAGWSSVELDPNRSAEIRTVVTPGSSVANGVVFDALITAKAVTDATRLDAVRLITHAYRVGAVPVPAQYTTSADFEKGRLAGVEATSIPDQLGLSIEPVTLPFIWVPNSNEGTVSKVDTRTGNEIARYRVCPETLYGNPSRTTIDQYGNCWVANRRTGTAVKIGLLENGQWIDRNHNGVPDTAVDLNGDGLIAGTELLPWGQDECVLWEVVLIPGREGTFAPGAYPDSYANDDWNPGARSVAVDATGNLWVGAWGTQRFTYVDGNTGGILRHVNVSTVNHTPYGAVIDRNGIVWSASLDKGHVLWLDPRDDSFGALPIAHQVYGLGLDRNDHLFIAGWQNSKLSRVNIATRTVDWTVDAEYEGRGVAVTADGTVWTANSGPGKVTYYSNEGRRLGQIPVGSTPTGVAIDSAGKVWVVNNVDGANLRRIDPATFAVDLSKAMPGTAHYGYSDMTGFVSRNSTTRIGFWTKVHDGQVPNAAWRDIVWHADQPEGSKVVVKVRSSNDRAVWSAWETAANNSRLAMTPPGRYLEIEVTLQASLAGVSPVFKDLRVSNALPAPVDLAISQEALPSPVRVEHPLRFSVTVTNRSDAWASGVIVTNPLPANAEPFQVTVPGGSYSLSNELLTVRFAGVAPQGTARFHLDLIPDLTGPLTNVASVGANETDTTPGNNRSTLAVTVNPLSCLPTPPGIVAWWSGDQHALDLIGENHGALYNGAGFVPGRSQEAFSFDGADDYLEVSDSPELRLTNAVSIEFWAKRQRLGVDLVLEKGGDWNVGEANYGVGLHNVNNNMFYFFFRGGWRGVRGVADLNWHHYAVVAEQGRNNPRFFIDGLERPVDYRDGSTWINLYPSTRPLHLGAQIDPRATYFGSLLLDEVAIHGRPLGEDEIAAIYDARSANKCKSGLRIVEPEALRDGVVGRTYRARFAAALGTAPYTFKVVGGSLPSGLTLATDGTLGGTPTQAGAFHFTVQANDATTGTAQQVMALTVQACVPAPEGLVAWWPGENNSDDIVSTNHGTAGAALQYQPGRVGQAFRFLDQAESQVALPNSPDLLPPNQQLTIEAWVKPDFSNVGDKLITILSKREGCGTFSYHLGVTMGHRGWTNGLMYFGFSGMGGLDNLDVLLSSKPVPDDGQWHHVAATYNPAKGNQNALLYLDGEVVGSLDVTKPLPATTWGPFLGRHGGCGYYSSAWVDEVSLYHRDLSPAEIQSIIDAGAAGKCFASPVDLLVKLGSEADAAYASNDVYQEIPAGAQIRTQGVAPLSSASYQVKVENDSAAPRSFSLRATETGDLGWTVRYFAEDVEINSLLHSQTGWDTGILAPGASRVVRVEATPSRSVPGNSAVSAFIHAISGPTANRTWDAIEVRTVCLALTQLDLLVRRDADVNFLGNDVYHLGGLGQTRSSEVAAGGTAVFHAQLGNDGNVAFRCRLKGPAGANGWNVRYTGGRPALMFDGLDDHLAIADAPALNPRAFTVEGWFNFASIGGIRVLVAKPLGAGSGDSIAVWLDGAQLRAIAQDFVRQAPMLAYNWPHPAGTWHHVAYTFDDDANRHALLVDGVEVTGADTDVTLAYDAHPFLIGADIEGGRLGYFLHGATRDVRFWNRARSAAQIGADLNRRLTGSETGLVGLWRLDEGTGETARDSSPSGVNGRLVNGPAWSFLGGEDLTAAIVSASGWSYLALVLSPGQTYDLMVTVTPSAQVAAGASQEVMLETYSIGLPESVGDAVKMVATAEQTAPVAQGGAYSTQNEFEQGNLVGVDAGTQPGRLQLGVEPVALPFIWVPNSNEGTISKIDTRTGRELARYRVCPENLYGNPSRTTVDQLGNCWVANRRTGTAVKVGLFENGQWNDRNHDTIIQTSYDADGDGLIAGAELLPWGQDECVLHEVILIPGQEGTFPPGGFTGTYGNDDWNPGPRGVAVDGQGHVWLGINGANNVAMRRFYKVDGTTGAILANIDVSSVGHTSYGAVVDRHGILWSSGQDKNHVLRLDTKDNSFGTIPIGHFVYGLNVDDQDHLFISGWQSAKLTRLNVVTGQIDWTRAGVYESRGVAVTPDGDVWTANSGPGTVTRWSNDGVIKQHIAVGNQPTGVAVDSFGKVWAVNFGDGFVKRIDPATDKVTLAKEMPGTAHYGYSDMTGFVSRNATVRFGSWTVTHNARHPDAYWGTITWTAQIPEGAAMTVQARSSEDGVVWSNWEPAFAGTALNDTPPGKYLQVQVNFRASASDESPVLEDLSIQPLAGPPRLTALPAPGGTGVRLISSTPLDVYALEYTVNLEDWLPATEQPVLINGQVVITVDPTGSHRFFRLRHK